MYVNHKSIKTIATNLALGVIILCAHKIRLVCLVPLPGQYTPSPFSSSSNTQLTITTHRKIHIRWTDIAIIIITYYILVGQSVTCACTTCPSLPFIKPTTVNQNRTPFFLLLQRDAAAALIDPRPLTLSSTCQFNGINLIPIDHKSKSTTTCPQVSVLSRCNRSYTMKPHDTTTCQKP